MNGISDVMYAVEKLELKWTMRLGEAAHRGHFHPSSRAFDLLLVALAGKNLLGLSRGYHT